MRRNRPWTGSGATSFEADGGIAPQFDKLTASVSRPLVHTLTLFINTCDYFAMFSIPFSSF